MQPQGLLQGLLQGLSQGLSQAATARQQRGALLAVLTSSSPSGQPIHGSQQDSQHHPEGRFIQAGCVLLIQGPRVHLVRPPRPQQRQLSQLPDGPLQLEVLVLGQAGREGPLCNRGGGEAGGSSANAAQ